MADIRPVVFLIALCFIFTVSCGNDNNGPMSQKEVIDIAAHHLMGKSFDRTPPSTIAYRDGIYTVSFRQQVPGAEPGETYINQVVFEAKTRELLKIEIITEETRTETEAGDEETESEGLISRPTPLDEETDEIAAVQKRVLGK